MKKNYLIFILYIVIFSTLIYAWDLNLGEYKQNDDYFLFYAEPYELVYDKLPTDKHQIIKKNIKITATADKHNIVAFSIYAKKDLGYVKIEVDNPYIDVRIIKPIKTNGGWIQYLLVDNDTINLDGYFDYDNLPSMPELDYAIVKIDKSNIKTIWLDINIPENVPEGEYEESIKITPENSKSENYNLKVKVLPVKLLKPDKILGIFHYDTISYLSFLSIEDKPRYKKQLEDIKEHGFNSISTWARFTKLDRLTFIRSQMIDIFKMIKDAGFDKKVIQWRATERDTNIRRSIAIAFGYEPYFFGVDEPYHEWPYRLVNHIIMSKFLHEKGGKVAATISKEAADALKGIYYEGDDWRRGNMMYSELYTKDWSDYGLEGCCINYSEPLDISIYNIMYPWRWSKQQEVHYYIDGLQKGIIEKNPEEELYYWHPDPSNMKQIRFYSGYFLYNSRLDGTFAGLYTNEFDDAYHRNWRAYPTQEGLIPTVALEAVREGIDDYRYVYTLSSLVEETKQDPEFRNKAVKIEDELNARMEKYKKVAYDLDNNIYTFDILTMEQFDKDREWIINNILYLQNLN